MYIQMKLVYSLSPRDIEKPSGQMEVRISCSYELTFVSLCHILFTSESCWTFWGLLQPYHFSSALELDSAEYVTLPQSTLHSLKSKAIKKLS